MFYLYFFFVERLEKLFLMRLISILFIFYLGSYFLILIILVYLAIGSEEGEDRGDFIMFYNRVIIKIKFLYEVFYR